MGITASKNKNNSSTLPRESTGDDDSDFVEDEPLNGTLSFDLLENLKKTETILPFTHLLSYGSSIDVE
jgi:hypothetical protein